MNHSQYFFQPYTCLSQQYFLLKSNIDLWSKRDENVLLYGWKIYWSTIHLWSTWVLNEVDANVYMVENHIDYDSSHHMMLFILSIFFSKILINILYIWLNLICSRWYFNVIKTFSKPYFSCFYHRLAVSVAWT